MFVACTGATTDEIAAQIGEAQARKHRTTWDLVTLSIAGNDIGFADVLKACLDVNGWGTFDLTPGCDASEQDLRSAVDGLRSTLQRTYDLIASKVRSGGDVVVLGYPHLVEEEARWDRWRRGVLANCEGIESYDVGMLRSVTGYLNQQIAAAVDAADERHADDGVRFHFLDISQDPYEFSTKATDRHALCSPVPWLNGVSSSISSGDFRIGRSFHPMQVGHDNTARVLARFLREHVTFDDAVESTAAASAILGPKGLIGIAEFGDPFDAVVAELSRRYGSPTVDELTVLNPASLEFTGDPAFRWTTGTDGGSAGDLIWTYPVHREVCWRLLCVEASAPSRDGAQTFRAWTHSVWGDPTVYDGDPSDVEVDPAVTTDRGVGVGSTWRDFASAHPSDADVGEGGALYFQIVGWPATNGALIGGSGRVDASTSDFERPVIPLDAEVLSLGAGDRMAETCC
jgi:hypothetical protein